MADDLGFVPDEEQHADLGFVPEAAPKFTPHVEPLEGMSTGQKLLAGVGRGMGSMYGKGLELVGKPELFPAALAQAEADSGPLMQTAPGKIGSFIGENAPLAAITGLGGLARSALPKAAATIGRPLVSLAEGAAQGALINPQARLKGALGGAGLMGGLGLGGKLLGALGGKLAPAISEGAKFLESKGIPLSAGLARPGSWLSKLEELGQHSIVGGGVAEEARKKALTGLQSAAVKEALPPGMVAPGAGSVSEQLEALHGGFKRAYEWAKKAPVSSDVNLEEVFGKAVSDPGALADPNARQSVWTFLKNQHGILDEAKAAVENKAESMGDAVRRVRQGVPTREMGPLGGVSAKPATAAAPQLTAEPLLQIRSNIRDKIREYGQGSNPDWEKIRLLTNAEDAVTQKLEQHLPGDILEHLKATDKQYVPFKVLESAAYKAQDVGGEYGNFTPAQLGAAVRSASERGAYARGQAGPLSDLRQIAAAGREAFGQHVPQTGVSAYAIPHKLAPIAGPASALLNTQFGKRLLSGGTAGQRLLGAAQSYGFEPIQTGLTVPLLRMGAPSQ